MKTSTKNQTAKVEVLASGGSTHIRYHYQHVFVTTRATPGTGMPHWVPPIDLYETENEVILEVELAGVGSDEVQVQFTGRTVYLSGNRGERSESTVKAFHVMEIERGYFMRTIELPAPVEPDTVRAVFKDGLLVVRACKRHAALHGCRKARNREGLE